MPVGAGALAPKIPSTQKVDLECWWDFCHPETETEKLKNLEPTPASGANQTGYDLTDPGTSFKYSGAGLKWDTSGVHNRLDTLTNTSFFNGFHKNDTAWTLVYGALWQDGNKTSDVVSQTLLSTNHGSPAGEGIHLFHSVNGSDKLTLYIGNNGAGGHALTWDSTVIEDYAFMALSFDESGIAFARKNKSYITISSAKTISAAIPSPSSGNASYTFRIGASPTVGGQQLRTGVILQFMGFYNAALSVSQIDDLFDELADRQSFPNFLVG